MRAVNLLPRDVERAGANAGRAPVLLVAGGLAVVTASMVALYFSASGTVGDRRGQLEAAQGALTAAQQTAGPASGQSVVAQERANREAALAAALSARVPLDGLLRELSFVLPEDAWLTGLSAASPDQAAPTGSAGTGGATSGATPSGGSTAPPSSQATGATSITVEGATYSQDSVARVLSRLSVLPSLDDVRLTESQRVEPQAATAQPGAGTAKTGKAAKKAKKPKSIVTFTITATFAGGKS